MLLQGLKRFSFPAIYAGAESPDLLKPCNEFLTQKPGVVAGNRGTDGDVWNYLKSIRALAVPFCGSVSSQ